MSQEVTEDKALETDQLTRGQRLRVLLGSPRRLMAWAMSDWARAAAAVLAGLASIGAVVILWLVLGAGTPELKPVEVAEIFKALEEARNDEARQLVTRFEHQGDLPPDYWGLPAYVQGVVAFRSADQTLSEGTKKERYLLAAKYLEESRELGFPPGRSSEGLFLLGKSLYRSEQYGASQVVLNEALKASPARRIEIHSMLAGAYLNAPNPLLSQALEQNQLVLADPKAPPDIYREAMVRQAETLLRIGKADEAVGVLDKLPAGMERRADVLLLGGWATMEEARALRKKDPQANAVAVRDKYRAAIQTFRRVVKHDSMAVDSRAKAMYLIGICLQESGDTRGALDQYYRTYCDYINSPEALAASFQSAELNRRNGLESEAMSGYRRVLTSIKDVENYNNPWLPLDELRRRIIGAYQAYFSQQNYNVCLKLTAMMMPLVAEPRVVTLKAEACHAWGRKFLAEAETALPSRAETMVREGRRLLRSAGNAYLQLAQLHLLNREYTDDLWASAECLLEGHDYTTAVKVLREYLKNEVRRRYPLALVHMGEGMLAMGRVDDALEALSECINYYSRDAASFGARLLASQACMEKGDHKEAKRLLEENLNGDILAPSSEEWRDSLFALGRLYHSQGQYRDAISRLEEAVARYPDCPQAVEGRYLVAEGYRRSARQMRDHFEEDVAESIRQSHQRQVAQLFESALRQYELLENQLGRRQRTHELNALEKAILRNCCFAIGAVLFDLERYEAAVKAYSVASNRYQNTPEVLEAYLQLARAYRRLNKPNEARSALDQAKVALARMGPDQPFTESTNFGREQWAELLDWMGTLFQQAARTGKGGPFEG